MVVNGMSSMEKFGQFQRVRIHMQEGGRTYNRGPRRDPENSKLSIAILEQRRTFRIPCD